MARRYRRKCKHCKKFFIPDARNATRQHYCSARPCRVASKSASQQRWLSKPENHDVFKGPVHVVRVQAWRRAHPGYWRRCLNRGSHEGPPLQDVLITQLLDNKGESRQFMDPALQDLLNAQAIVFIGLIAQFTDSALQDDIVVVGRKLLQLGHDVLHGHGREEAGYGPQTADLPRQSQAPPAPIQLD